MTEDLFNAPIGDKEMPKLEALPVVVKKIDKMLWQNKEKTKTYGEKLILSCKHPKKDELIEISQIKFLKGDKVVTAPLKIQMDSDGKIQKGSPIAILMQHANVTSLSQLLEKTLATIYQAEDAQYLCIKAIS